MYGRTKAEYSRLHENVRKFNRGQERSRLAGLIYQRRNTMRLEMALLLTLSTGACLLIGLLISSLPYLESIGVQ